MKYNLIPFFVLNIIVSFGQMKKSQHDTTNYKLSNQEILNKSNTDLIKDSLKIGVDQFFIINDKPVSRQEYLEFLAKKNQKSEIIKNEK